MELVLTDLHYNVSYDKAGKHEMTSFCIFHAVAVCILNLQHYIVRPTRNALRMVGNTISSSTLLTLFVAR